MKAKKPKMGRPPLAAGAAKSAVVSLRLTEADHEALTAAAEAAEKSPAEWVRDAMRAALTAATCPRGARGGVARG